MRDAKIYHIHPFELTKVWHYKDYPRVEVGVMELNRLTSAEEQDRTIANMVGAMMEVPRAVQVRQIGHFMRADAADGEGVARGLGIEPGELG